MKKDNKIESLREYMQFGMFRGKTIEWICSNHPDYIFYLDEYCNQSVAEDIVEEAERCVPIAQRRRIANRKKRKEAESVKAYDKHELLCRLETELQELEACVEDYQAKHNAWETTDIKYLKRNIHKVVTDVTYKLNKLNKVK